MDNYYCASLFCDLNGLGLFQSHFQKAEISFFLKFWNRLINYFMAWAWQCSSTAWPFMMSHLHWAYIKVNQSVMEKDTEVYCKLFLFSDFLNKLLLAPLQKLKVILHLLATGGKRWWNNPLEMCEKFRWDCQSSNLQAWLYEVRAENAFRIALCQPKRLVNVSLKSNGVCNTST